MATATIDPPVAVTHLERIGFPPDLARKIVDIAIGARTEPVTKAETAAADRCLRRRRRAPDPPPRTP